MRMPGQKSLCRCLAATVGAATVAAVLVSPLRADAQEPPGTLREVGQMTPGGRGLPMAVDERRSLGFRNSAGGINGSLLQVMDLQRLVKIAETPTVMKTAENRDYPFGFLPESSLVLDEAHERLYVTGNFPQLATGTTNTMGTCRAKVDQYGGPRQGQPAFDYRVGSDGTRAVVQKRVGPMPCTGPEQAPFAGLVGSYDEEHDALYIGGASSNEVWRLVTGFTGVFKPFAGGTFVEDRGQPLLVRQLSIEDTGELAPMSDSFAPGAPKLALDWEVDLRVTGCGRRNHVQHTMFEGFVARLGDDVLAYCWDARPYRGTSQGQQGYLVRIPLTLDPSDGVMKPLSRAGGPAQVDPVTRQVNDFVARRTPTLPGDVTVILDKVSGRLMLVTTGSVNGNAVWVFEPKADRFVGVITGGYADQPEGNTAVGFDSKRGRVYVLTKAGILIAPIRIDPLPAGLLYPVLVNTEGAENFVGSNRISVAPRLGRLFVDRGDRYDVLEDRVPDPPVLVPPDPDSLTTQIPEQDGKTVSSASGQALASGAHVVNAGGVPRALGQNDPTCVFGPPNLQITDGQQDPVPDWEFAPALFGACLPELLVSAGHREAFVAATDLEGGTGSGVTARGAAFAFGSTDSGSDADVRRPTECGADTPDRADQWARQWPFPDGARLQGNPNDAPDGLSSWLLAPGGGPTFGGNQGNKRPFIEQYNDHRDAFWNGFVGSDQFQQGQKDYRAGCNELQDRMADNGGPDLRSGTRGRDGKGFPVQAAVCGDFGGNPSVDTWPKESDGAPQAGYPTSRAACDAGLPGGEGVASVGALALPTAAAPELSVARAWSKVTTARTPDRGQVTVALAVAEGVQVPAAQLSIGQVRSLAVTMAYGHKGTASAHLVRQWCAVTLAGQTEPGCIDPDTPEVDSLLDDLNSAVLQKLQLSVPAAERQQTKGGYQAVVTKHKGQRGGDQAVNDDDSHTVSALQAVVYNDGPNGRSRLIVQLAGVHAESRYGIIEAPNFDFGSPEEPTPEPAPTPEPEPAPVDPPGEPAPAPPPIPDTFTPESFVEEEFGEDPAEFVRFSAPAPRAVTVRDPGRDPVTRFVRVPVEFVSGAIDLLVQNPREAALLFVMWALLTTPVYLGFRRRSFARAVAAA